MRRLTFLSVLALLSLTGYSQDNSTIQNCDTTVFTLVSTMPEYEGGFKAYKSAFKKKLKASHEIGEYVKGTMYITFVVDCNNEAVDFKALRGLDEATDQSVISVLQSLQHWTSGAHVDKNVNCMISLAIYFDRGKVTSFTCPSCDIDPEILKK